MSFLPKSNLTHRTFANGYTASVLRFSDRDYEVAVLYNGLPVYDTPVTNDVVRCCNKLQASQILAEIENLPLRDADADGYRYL